ncbi:MAG TPA: HlyD family efflux transporter periplasmic adaptor subunit [Vicinamibacterales bacterium]|nr:HlyD family efflux transporter periplasmic adaptor subunit [Vicinamibacterales bacterium]
MRRLAIGAVLLAVVSMAGIAVVSLQPAAPPVDRASVWIDVVKRGRMLRDVRGQGTLVSEDLRWIPATTTGRVERIVLRPGTPVNADSVILQLSNPTLEQELEDARLKLKAAEASLASLRVQLDDEELQQRATAATIEADYKKAAMQADVNEQLAAQKLVSDLLLKQSKLDAEQLDVRNRIAQQQLAHTAESKSARLAERQSQVDQARAFMTLKAREVDALRVRPGVPGILQVVPVEVGQQVTPGTNLARVVNPSRLMAEVKVPETQAKDVQVGQRASIDTHNGIVGGSVTRIDPSVQNGTVTVDVAIDGPLPTGSRPDLSVDGTIELERLDNVLFVGRPAFGDENTSTTLFKMQPDGTAVRVPVKFGRSSVNSFEILSGIGEGDQVVLSDMSAWNEVDRVHIQ